MATRQIFKTRTAFTIASTGAEGVLVESNTLDVSLLNATDIIVDLGCTLFAVGNRWEVYARLSSDPAALQAVDDDRLTLLYVFNDGVNTQNVRTPSISIAAANGGILPGAFSVGAISYNSNGVTNIDAFYREVQIEDV